MACVASLFPYPKNRCAVLLDFDALSPDGDIMFLVADHVCAMIRHGYIDIGIRPLHRGVDAFWPQTDDMQIAPALERFKANR
jgi:hypothetical protein